MLSVCMPSLVKLCTSIAHLAEWIAAQCDCDLWEVKGAPQRGRSARDQAEKTSTSPPWALDDRGRCNCELFQLISLNLDRRVANLEMA